MDRTSLRHRTLVNTSYNFIGFFWSIVFSIFVTPAIVFSLGIKEYGVFIFINTLISFAGLLDLGLSTAITRQIAFYIGGQQLDKIRKVIKTANFFFILIGIAGFIIMAVSGFVSKDYFLLFILGGMIFFINSITSVCSLVIQSLQRFDIYSKIGIVSLTVSQLSILLLAILHFTLRDIFISQVIIAAATSVATCIMARTLLPLPLFEIGFDKKEAAESYKFAFSAFINSASSSALSYLDRIIIPLFIGASNLTYYSIAGSAAMKIPGISNNLASSLFPTVAQLQGNDDKETIKKLYIRSFRLITIVAAAFSVTLFSLSHEVLLYWLDSTFAEKAATTLMILTITNFIIALFSPLSNFLLGLGKLKALTITSFSCLVLNMTFLFILLPRYGITGGAWAYLLSLFPILYLFYFSEKHYLHLEKRKRYYLLTFARTAFTGAAVFFIDTLLLKSLMFNLLSVCIVGAVSATLYFLIYKLCGFFEEEDWRDMEHFFASIIDKYVPALSRKFFRLWIRLTGKPRPGSYPYLSGDSFRLLADHIHDETGSFDPSKVANGDIVFVSNPLAFEYMQNIHPSIRQPYILIIHNGDTHITESVIDLFDEKIHRAYVEYSTVDHPKVTHLPIGLENLHYHVNGIPSVFNRIRKMIKKRPPTRKDGIFYYFNVKTNPAERTKAMEHLSASPLAETVPSMLYPEAHVKKLATYKFVASPPGNGRGTSRTWEALYVGTVPIVNESVSKNAFAALGLPLWVISDWKDIDNLTEDDLHNKYDMLMQQANWEPLFMDFWINLIKKNQSELRGK